VNVSSFLIVALAAGALGAQDAPRLDRRFQVFAETYRPAKIQVAIGIDGQPSRQTGGGFRFMGEIAPAPGWFYELGGMFDGSSNFTVNTTNLNLTQLQVLDSYWTLGTAYLAKFGESLTLGGHLEARGEYLRVQGEADVNGAADQVNLSTTYLRPWVRGSADYTFTGIGQSKHPYIGLEGAYALMKTTQNWTPDFSNMDGRNLRALAPRASAALYVGIRF